MYTLQKYKENSKLQVTIFSGEGNYIWDEILLTDILNKSSFNREPACIY